MSEALAAADDCMICFEKPTLYGLLQNCNHQFCFECIKQWRKSNSRPSTADDAGPTRAQLEDHFMNNLRESDIQERRLSQAAQGLMFDDGVYRSGYRAAIAALEAGTFELGPHAPVNVERAARLSAQDEESDDFSRGFSGFIESIRTDYQDSRNTSKVRNTRTCPLCREPSAHIIPAARFPQNAQEKEHLAKGFYAEKKRILCRDFEASLNSIEGYYCPRFNDCLYAHLKASVSPNSQVRNEPFTFTAERIKQLRMRRRQEQGHTAEFLRFLRSSPAHFPLFVTERIERLLQTLIIDLTAAQAEPIARALVGEFHNNFGSALIDLRGYAHPRARSLAEARLQNTPTDHFDALVHIIREYDADGVLMLMTQRDAEWSNSNLPENLQEWRMPTLQIEQDEQIIYHYVTTRGTFINTSEHHNDHLDLMRDLGRKNNEQGDVGSNSSADLHMYHIFHDDGSRPEMRAAIPASIFEDFPTHVEFIEPIKMNFAGLDSLTHHFMSPCSVEEARAIFLLSPGYLATRAALDANQAGMQHLDEVGERTILAFERGGNNSSRNRLPNGLPFLPMGVPRDNIFDELDEDDYDFHEYYESDENPWNAYMAGAHGLESALYDDEDVDDDNDDDDDEDNDSGDDEDADGISSDEESDDDMPGIVPVESDDGDTWGTVSERSARTDSDGEDMLCHATVEGDSSGAEEESRLDRAVLSTESFQHDTSGQEDSMEEDNVGDASSMPSVD